MEQNKQHFNIWKYLPTWKEAKWWVLIGIAYHSLTMYLFGHGCTQGSIFGVFPRWWLIYITPILWLYHLHSSVFGTYPSIARGELFAYGAFLGGLAGYLLRTITKLVIGR